MKKVIRNIINWWNGCSEEEALQMKAYYEECAKHNANGANNERKDSKEVKETDKATNES